MPNSSATRQTEICRSTIMISSTVRILSSVSAIVDPPLRGTSSSKACVGSLNSATHFATVRYDGAESPQTSANSLVISIALSRFRMKNLTTMQYSVFDIFDVLTNNPYTSAIFLRKDTANRTKIVIFKYDNGFYLMI